MPERLAERRRGRMREVVKRFRWGRHALLAAAAWLGIVTAVAGYFLWADHVDVYSFRALFVALVLMPAAVALMVYALSFYDLGRVAAVALSVAIAGGAIYGGLAYAEYQRKTEAREAAALMEAQYAAHRAELWGRYGAAMRECRGTWLDYGGPNALRECVADKVGAPLDAHTWRALQEAEIERDPLLAGLPDR